MTKVGGQNILLPFGDYKYHASLVPDEDDLTYIDVKYGVITDPNGYKIEVKDKVKYYIVQLML